MSLNLMLSLNDLPQLVLQEGQRCFVITVQYGIGKLQRAGQWKSFLSLFMLFIVSSGNII